MFFTSYEFLFLFLPVVWTVFMLLAGSKRAWLASHWLIIASLLFYASLDGAHLPHLLALIALNGVVAMAIRRRRLAAAASARAWLWAGVLLDIAFLAWFKYFETWRDPADASIPIGISFYTLQLIAFLVAVHNEDVGDLPWPRYVLFATFFPYVVAGPVVTRQEVFSQLGALSASRAQALLLPALTLFAIGMFKKVVLADQVGVEVDKVYAAAPHHALAASDAWAAALLYTLQLYFDFSGYSDMAAGLAGLFGIRLPRNFHSPLKATSIMEFWRRWHMSATRFFTHHFYLPVVVKAMRMAVRWKLQGMSRFLFTVVMPMLVTFFLIGIWHGAGLTAAAFGLLMGAAISINHLWIKFALPALPRWLGWLLTMLVVVVGMVFSRADTLQDAAAIFTGMLGVGSSPPPLLDPFNTLAWILALGVVVLVMPNSHQVLERHPVVLPETWDGPSTWQKTMVWTHGLKGALVTSLIFSAVAVMIPKAAQFIYYRF